MENIQLYVRNTEEVSNNLKLDLVGRSPVLTRLIFMWPVIVKGDFQSATRLNSYILEVYFWSPEQCIWFDYMSI